MGQAAAAALPPHPEPAEPASAYATTLRCLSLPPSVSPPAPPSPLLLSSSSLKSHLETVLLHSSPLLPCDCVAVDNRLFKVEHMGSSPLVLLPSKPALNQQPLTKVLFGSTLPLIDFERLQLLLKRPTIKHLAVGDCLVDPSMPRNAYFVMDVEPGSGLLTPNTSIHLWSSPLPLLRRVRFGRADGEPAASSTLLKDTLKKRSNRLYLTNQSIVYGDAGEAWAVLSLDDESADKGVFTSSTLVALSDARRPQPSRCCGDPLEPPEANRHGLVFACPHCNRLVINPAAALWQEMEAAPPGPGHQLILRVRAALVTMTADDDRVRLMIQILERLPRDIYGRLNVLVLDEIARRVERMEAPALAGVSTTLVQRLPTCRFREGLSDTRCDICLADFVPDQELRILPCFHKFHSGCIDSWLAVASTCPLCKHRVTDLEEVSS